MCARRRNEMRPWAMDMAKRQKIQRWRELSHRAETVAAVAAIAAEEEEQNTREEW